ncbi:MAG: deoxyribonuclease IV [Bacilli bacterium]|nr:deoxyribonuclease IV [Bacilli bacterium]
MLYIGSHVGFNKNTQILGSVLEACSYGANTFMFYTGAPQNTMRNPIDDKLVNDAISKMKEVGIDFSKVVVHAPYIINLCNEEKFDFSVGFLRSEVERVHKLGVKYMVLHPGSHVGLGVDKGIENIISGLNLVLKGDTDVVILLETMAGKGSEVGSTLEEIKRIIDGVEDKSHIGVCLDTCHLNDAGYDMSDFDKYLDYFDDVIGIEKIGCIHINDSKNELNSHKDRHENIGFGTIGFNNLINIIYNERLKEIPRILETPYVDKEYPPYKYEIEMIRSKIFDENLLDKIRKQS